MYCGACRLDSPGGECSPILEKISQSADNRFTPRLPGSVLHHLLPEGDVAGGEQGVFAGVPAKEVRRVGVPRVGFAAGPDFVKQEGAGAIGGAVQVVSQAAVFFAGGAHQGAQLGFEEHFLGVAWA